MNIQAEEARLFALKFRQEHPDLVRECIIDMPQWGNLSYGEIAIVDDEGNVGEYRHIGDGGRMECTTGNILVYNRDEYWDYSVILPNMTVGDTFNEAERKTGETFVWTN